MAALFSLKSRFPVCPGPGNEEKVSRVRKINCTILPVL